MKHVMTCWLCICLINGGMRGHETCDDLLVMQKSRKQLSYNLAL